MAHDSERGSESDEITNETAEDGSKSLLNRRSYMKLSAAAAATVGAATVAGTASAATSRHGISFDRVVDAVDDLGWDPDGDDPIDVPNDDGLLIEVPPGDYVFRGTGSDDGIVDGDLRNWGLRGLGDGPRDVTFRANNGESGYFVRAGYNSNGILLENFTFDNTDDRRGGDIGNFLQAQDNVEVHDVDHVGFSGREPYCRWSMLPAMKSSGGTANIVNYNKTGPSVFAGHGASDGGGGVFDHEGHVNFKNCEISNQGGDGGLYTGKHNGSIVFEDCVFHNNDMAGIRTAAGSELRNCEIVIDWDNAHPDNVIDDQKAPTGTMGVYFSSAQYGKSGGGIYNCDIRILSTYKNAMAGILINPSDGDIDIHNTSVHVDVDGLRPVWFMDPREQRFDSHTTPDRPWGASIKNLVVTGSGDCKGKAAVIIEGRDGTTITDSCIQMPNGDGIHIDGADDCTVENTNVNVGGRATAFRDSSVSTNGLTKGDRCPLPDETSTGPNGGSSGGSGGSDDSSGSDGSNDSGSDGSSSQSLTITADANMRYHVRADNVSEAADAGDQMLTLDKDGNGAYGALAKGQSVALTVDAFRCAAVDPEDGATMKLDDEVLPVENYGTMSTPAWEVGLDVPVPTGGSTDDGSGDGSADQPESGDGSPATISIIGLSDDQVAEYTFTTDGSVESDPDRGTFDDEDNISGGTVSGTVAGGVDSYIVSGAITAFDITEGAEVYRDDLKVDPQSLVEESSGSDDSTDGSTGGSDGSNDSSGSGDSGRGSTGGSDGSGDTTLPEGQNVVSVVGTSEGETGVYQFTVTEAVEPNPEKGSFDANDKISGTSAEGTVAGGVDSYVVTGEFSEFVLEGSAEVYLNGEQVDHESLVTADGVPENSITVVGTAEEPATYQLTVDGSVVPNPEKGTFDDEDNIVDKSAEGAVVGGTDSYRFSGAVTHFELNGPAVVYVNGEQVSPDLLGEVEDPRLGDLIVVDGTGSSGRCDYQFSVDGHVEKSLELGDIEAEDTIRNGTVAGTVEGERDAYRFAGTLTGFRMDGSATLRFQPQTN
ncbi:right-handed parallel beta-helix repeat-containing protein [Halomarina rubra]|uniref:Right-handed parallel beta-helix repeat-containing protein n=1 Tax=Halomarina rubra TaxID=2071873 RepID=A0ABD6B0U0_9EURY|nr:right-handed parallel beta-helix repeat-containing protein [Halomarina rubra]